jgi:hypothetical protein
MYSPQNVSLEFNEVVLESNEIDLEELQGEEGFTERRFP